MKIQTNRLTIVSCTQEIVTTALKNDYQVGPHISSYLEQLKKDPTLLGWGPWFVMYNEQFIGDIGFKGKPNQENTVEVGYGIIPIAQGKGYATEAVGELIRWSFTTGKVDKIIAECLVTNVPSIRVLDKLGMKQTYQNLDMLFWELQR
ncbi:GNAT family N-acetyltransferase [Bacillus pinisoli]|uniref:GNAT family N-acetyltransferase n=1 Tax=Bacillus pinisoli TaxID=2901866 RepID=UPI001FF1D59C|nr:GNAT family N-acetyltransferase [Bacillus pinisoli]